jgi:hypothetical protein
MTAPARKGTALDDTALGGKVLDVINCISGLIRRPQLAENVRPAEGNAIQSPVWPRRLPECHQIEVLPCRKHSGDVLKK